MARLRVRARRMVLAGSLLALGVLAQDEQLERRLELGGRLYLLHCADCHGVDGDGFGPRYDITYARPRSFASGLFKLATTENGVPSEEDLIRTISRGMPGTGMPNWGWLPEEEVAALALYVRRLGIEALEAVLDERVSAGELTPGEAGEILARRTRPGPPLEVPQEPPVTPAGLKRGAELYRQACASCHGENGDPPVGGLKTDFEGNWLPPPSLRAAAFKGGSEGRQLFARIAVGMNGTAMPGFDDLYDSDELWDLVHHVQSLAAAGPAEARTELAERAAGGGGPSPPPFPPSPESSPGPDWELIIVALALGLVVVALALLALGR